jgi:hypothetical protein
MAKQLYWNISLELMLMLKNKQLTILNKIKTNNNNKSYNQIIIPNGIIILNSNKVNNNNKMTNYLPRSHNKHNKMPNNQSPI